MPRKIWVAQEGSQRRFLSCPVFECLYEGSRGPGKTDALLMDFAQHAGQGLGPSWRGVLFRVSLRQLDEVIAKSKKWFFPAFSGIRFLRNELKWHWPTGEELLFRQISGIDDYWKYHGHEYPWIGWEELTNWPDPGCYESMLACCRSSDPKVPRKYRATANPWGPGHNWVKRRFVDPTPPGVIIYDKDRLGRVRIHGSILENKTLLKAQPDYLKQLNSLSDQNQKRAWLYGNWDIVAGGALDDLWDRKKHVVTPFKIPASWRVNRSFDWGSARPFSVGWWAESDGTPVMLSDSQSRTYPRGTLFRISEYYGWNGIPNQGSKMLAREVAWMILKIERELGLKVSPGPADNQIFNLEDGHSIAEEMTRVGVRWERSDKSPGSRKTGLEKLRAYLKASLEPKNGLPGLYVFSNCVHFIRTIPLLRRCEKEPDDIDTGMEDHVYDETRYRLLSYKPKLVKRKIKGF
ncbi:MAG: terminase [Deltaproteobacteria bacterium]|nr:terminase [Deltaproteobacteria bacterium]